MKTFTELNLEKVERIPTGLHAVDDVMGGGVPVGRLIELAGKQSTGKSSLACQILASFQRQGKKCAYIDIERTFDSEYAQTLGVDLSTLLFPIEDEVLCSEKVWDIIDKLIREEGTDLIILESVAQLIPKAELEGNYDQQHMALAGRINSQSLRKIVPMLSIKKCSLLCINQVRDNIGVFGHGSKTTNPGGNALRFAYSIQLELTRTGNTSVTVKGEKIVTGTTNRLRCTKNKTAPPYKECELINVFCHGFNPKVNLYRYAEKKGVIKKDKNTYYFGKLALPKAMELDDDTEAEIIKTLTLV